MDKARTDFVVAEVAEVVDVDVIVEAVEGEDVAATEIAA